MIDNLTLSIAVAASCTVVPSCLWLSEDKMIRHRSISLFCKRLMRAGAFGVMASAAMVPMSLFCMSVLGDATSYMLHSALAVGAGGLTVLVPAKIADMVSDRIHDIGSSVPTDSGL